MKQPLMKSALTLYMHWSINTISFKNEVESGAKSSKGVSNNQFLLASILEGTAMAYSRSLYKRLAELKVEQQSKFTPCQNFIYFVWFSLRNRPKLVSSPLGQESISSQPAIVLPVSIGPLCTIVESCPAGIQAHFMSPPFPAHFHFLLCSSSSFPQLSSCTRAAAGNVDVAQLVYSCRPPGLIEN